MASEKIQQFCADHGIDTKHSYFAALCMDEMASNVVKHGFSSDNKEHTLNTKVVYKNKTITLRIKDDCRPFNPKEMADFTSENETGKTH